MLTLENVHSLWPYLVEDAFQVRQQIAAHFVKDVAQVVELGGYLKSVSSYLPREQCYLGIDPLVTPSQNGKHTILSQKYEEVADFSLQSSYALVCLGCYR